MERQIDDSYVYDMLKTACKNGNEVLAKHILDYMRSCSSSINKDLLAAANNSDMQLAKYIVDKRMVTLTNTFDGYTDNGILIWCIENNHIDFLMNLLTFSKITTFDNDAGGYLLHHSLKCKQFDVAKYLLNNNADINFEPIYGAGILYQCIFNKNIAAAKFLCENNVDIRQSHLQYACFNNNLEMAKLLLQSNPNMDISGIDMRYASLEMQQEFLNYSQKIKKTKRADKAC